MDRNIGLSSATALANASPPMDISQLGYVRVGGDTEISLESICWYFYVH
jgi:hypothetical protein